MLPLSHQDTGSKLEDLHSYRTWRFLGQAQMRKRPKHKNRFTVRNEPITMSKGFSCLKVVTVCKTSKVTVYCMFSMEASRTLLSGSIFFPSTPRLNCKKAGKCCQRYNPARESIYWSTEC